MTIKQILHAAFLWLSFLHSAMAASGEELKSLVLDNETYEINYVNTFGRWQANHTAGVFRFIVLHTKGKHPHSKAFIQWMERDSSNKNKRVFALTAIAEINDAGIYRLFTPKIQKLPAGETVTMATLNLYNQQMSSFILIPKEPGQYEIHDGSNQASAKLQSKPLTQSVQGENFIFTQEIPLTLDYYLRPTF